MNRKQRSKLNYYQNPPKVRKFEGFQEITHRQHIGRILQAYADIQIKISREVFRTYLLGYEKEK